MEYEERILLEPVWPTRHLPNENMIVRLTSKGILHPRAPATNPVKISDDQSFPMVILGFDWQLVHSSTRCIFFLENSREYDGSPRVPCPNIVSQIFTSINSTVASDPWPEMG
jgi:hypothetical protein